jgi:uncharacterized protein YdhG (YjbR/CyaY superfamily)
VTPEDYIAALDEPRRSEIAELDALIRSVAPDLEPDIYSGMLGYGTYHYKYESGREGDAPIVALASRARYISLYANVGVADRHRDELPRADIGKSCIRFKRLEDVDRDVLAAVIRETAEAGGTF